MSPIATVSGPMPSVPLNDTAAATSNTSVCVLSLPARSLALTLSVWLPCAVTAVPLTNVAPSSSSSLVAKWASVTTTTGVAGPLDRLPCATPVMVISGGVASMVRPNSSGWLVLPATSVARKASR